MVAVFLENVILRYGAVEAVRDLSLQCPQSAAGALEKQP